MGKIRGVPVTIWGSPSEKFTSSRGVRTFRQWCEMEARRLDREDNEHWVQKHPKDNRIAVFQDHEEIVKRCATSVRRKSAPVLVAPTS